MRVGTCLLYSYCALLCNQYCVGYSKPLIGQSIRNSQSNEFPFIVSFMRINVHERRPRKNHICTGSLISRQDVITSEHCIIYESIDETQIFAGSYNLNRGIRYYIFWWITFEQWATINGRKITTEINDIAVIRLLDPVPSAICPVQLTNMQVRDLYGLQATVAGWGRANTTYISNILKVVELRIISNSECIQRLRNVGEFVMTVDKKNMLCSVAEPYALLNNGDSGGPLLLHNVLIGINKGTAPNILGNNHPNLTNAHMAIYFYKKFLISVINDVN